MVEWKKKSHVVGIDGLSKLSIIVREQTNWSGYIRSVDILQFVLYCFIKDRYQISKLSHFKSEQRRVFEWKHSKSLLKCFGRGYPLCFVTGVKYRITHASSSALHVLNVFNPVFNITSFRPDGPLAVCVYNLCGNCWQRWGPVQTGF